MGELKSHSFLHSTSPLSPILVVAELDPTMATTTNEPHSSSSTFQGKVTGEASDMVSTDLSPIPLSKELTPPRSKENSKEEPFQHSNDNRNNYNKTTVKLSQSNSNNSPHSATPQW